MCLINIHILTYRYIRCVCRLRKVFWFNSVSMNFSFKLIKHTTHLQINTSIYFIANFDLFKNPSISIGLICFHALLKREAHMLAEKPVFLMILINKRVNYGDSQKYLCKNLRLFHMQNIFLCKIKNFNVYILLNFLKFLKINKTFRTKLLVLFT